MGRASEASTKKILGVVGVCGRLWVVRGGSGVRGWVGCDGGGGCRIRKADGVGGGFEEVKGSPADHQVRGGYRGEVRGGKGRSGEVDERDDGRSMRGRGRSRETAGGQWEVAVARLITKTGASGEVGEGEVSG